jgi:hypothetical protein
VSNQLTQFCRAFGASAGAKGHAATRVAVWNPARVLDRIAGELDAELEDLAAARAAGKRREARDVAVVVGILVDKAQALADRFPDHGGHLDAEASVERIRQLLDVIEYRRR